AGWRRRVCHAKHRLLVATPGKPASRTQTTQNVAMPRYQQKTFTPLEGLLQSIQLDPGNDHKGRVAAGCCAGFIPSIGL
ncbi:hypothetical protein, partial [Acidocella sp. MX-AZ02]|uniref:hypothetical protein n=1 Tax=Acidocella sp. MX-AZ02 TaxID=1214225 RepID=UPI00196A0A73